MCRLFDEWKTEIKNYCEQNGLSFEAAQKMSQAWNKTSVVLYHPEKNVAHDGHPCPQLTLPTAKRVADFHRQVTAHFGQTKLKKPLS